MTDVHIEPNLRYDVPAGRIGNEPNSVIGRGLGSHSHNPEALRRQLGVENKETTPAQAKTATRLGEMGVADTVAKPSEADIRLEAQRQEYIAAGVIDPNAYWDDAPNGLAPARRNAYTDIPEPVADRFNPEAYVGQAPVLPNPSK